MKLCQMRVAVTLLVLLPGCGVLNQSGPGDGVPVATQAQVPVGTGPILLAIAPDGSRVYAAAERVLAAIDTATNTVVAQIPIDPNPTGLAITPDGRRALVTTLFGVRVIVVDLASNQVLSPIQLPLDLNPGGYGRIAVTPDGATAYVANSQRERISIVDLGTGESQNPLLDMRVIDAAVAPDGRSAYLAGCRSFCATGTLEGIDTTSGQITRTLTTGPQPNRLALSPDGTRAYTTNVAGGTLSVVDLANDVVLATLPAGVTPTGLAVSRDGARIYVASQTSGSITVIDGATNTVSTTLSVGEGAREVVVMPDGHRLYVSVRDRVVALAAPAR